MTARHTGQHRLEVENFGPIAKADIELRPLTVFVGPSSTGKSYLAKLIYALHGYFSGHLALRNSTWRATDFRERAHATRDLAGVVEWVEKYVDSDAAGEGELACPEDVANLARAAVRFPNVGSVLTRELLRVFGAYRLSDLVLKSEHQGRLTLSHTIKCPGGQTASFQHNLGIAVNSKSLEYDLQFPDNAPIRLERSGTYWTRALDPGFFYPPSRRSSTEPLSLVRLQAVLADLAQPCTVGAISRPAFYLPAGRSGVVEAHGVLLSSSLDRMTRGRHKQQGSISGILADFIRQTFVDLRSGPSDWEGGEQLAKRVEETIIHGTVRVDEPEVGPLSILYRPTGWEEDLPLNRVSSMVAEIVPLVLYLRHYVTLGSTIIIEEPEAHMHPAMQIRFAAAVARIVEAGVRVVITAHSGWVLSALANLVRLADLPKDQRRDIVGGNVTLAARDTGAWLFVPGDDGGTVTEELPLSSENGMYEAGFPAVAQALYHDWAEISSRLQED